MTKHNIKADGAAFHADGSRVQDGTTMGLGSAICSCGESSEALPTRAARKSWHAEHKAAAAAESEGPVLTGSFSDETVAQMQADAEAEAASMQENADEVEATIEAQREQQAEVTVTREYRGRNDLVMLPLAEGVAQAYGNVTTSHTITRAVRTLYIAGEQSVVERQRSFRGREQLSTHPYRAS